MAFSWDARGQADSNRALAQPLPARAFLLAQTLAGGLSACVVCVNMAALLTNERRCRSSARLPLLPGARSDASGCSVPKIALQDGVQLAVMAWVFL